MNRWFRFYDESLNNKKVQNLRPDLFKAWVNLLCVASKHGGVIPSLGDVAFNLRLSEAKAAVVVTELATAKLLDKVDGGYFAPHDWNERQYKSDTSADRMREYRKRNKTVTKNVSSDAECDVTSDGESIVTVTPSVTRPETEAETETDSEPSLSLPKDQNIKSFGEAKSEKRTPPRHGLKSKDWIYCEKGTPEWKDYAADFASVRGFEPNANPDNGRWFHYLGEAYAIENAAPKRA